MKDRGIVSAAPQEGELQFEASLRPRRLEEFTGQSKLKENLAIAIEAARKRGEVMNWKWVLTGILSHVRARQV